MAEDKDDKNETNSKITSKNTISKLIVLFIVIGVALTAYNQLQILGIKSGLSQNLATGLTFVQAEVIPTGMPEIYGQELNIRYDDVNQNNPELADKTITVMGLLDKSINLEGEQLERYIDITSEMSCEYCCGTNSIIVRREDAAELDKKIDEAISAGKITREQGESFRRTPGIPACGCAHSFAMRGLAKYLILNHGSEFTNEEILNELGKWKTLFFPGQMAAKADALKNKNIEFSYANLGSNRYRGIEAESSGNSQMVGGC